MVCGHVAVGTAGVYDIAQLQASLDARRGPAQYGQVQAVMALKGLIVDRSVLGGGTRAPADGPPGSAAAVEAPTGSAAEIAQGASKAAVEAPTRSAAEIAQGA